MSHRPSCPDPDDARYEGRRAGERGYLNDNPYDHFGRTPCEEAEREWADGYRAGERRREEDEAEERAAERRARERREESEMEEARYYEAQQFASDRQFEDG